MAFNGLAGGHGHRRGPSGLGGRGSGRNMGPSTWHGGANGHSGFSERSNPLWADQVQNEDAFPHLDPLPASSRIHWERCAESREMLTKLAAVTKENWDSQEYVECSWDYAEAAYEAKKLKKHAMLVYFPDRAPLLQDFKEWIEYEMGVLRGWPTMQIKFLRKNFFLVYFEEFIHREEALNFAPWFMENRFTYTFRWESHFDVRLETNTLLPVWIELPFRSMILEKCRKRVSGALGKVFYYIHGDKISSFPHDRACILWDTTRAVPKSVKIKLTEGIAIWQPVSFRNIPYHCFKCNKRGHLARDCGKDRGEDLPTVVPPTIVSGAPPVDPELNQNVSETPHESAPPSPDLHHINVDPCEAPASIPD
ncbi:unnamed protein product [Calypogeia fissa]